MKLTLDDRQVRLLRLRLQWLHPPTSARPSSPEQVLEEVCGVQAQELPAAWLAVHARSKGLALADIERSRQEAHTIVRTWCMRSTLHLVTSEDARWLIPLLSPTFMAGDQRRMAELGWDDERSLHGMRVLREALSEKGALTREEITTLLMANGLPYQGQATIHLIARAAWEGILCQGPDRGKQPTFVSFEGWVGAARAMPRAAALAELARRYLAAYAPATPEDLASWSGLKRSVAREAWQLIEDQLIPVETSLGPMALLNSQLPWIDEVQDNPPVVRLLPKYDTYLLGYASRDLIVEPAYAKHIHPGGGLIYPTLMVDGRLLGIWTAKLRRVALEVTVETFKSLADEILPLLELEVDSLGRFLGAKADLKIKPLSRN
jgi:hypothetical protein